VQVNSTETLRFFANGDFDGVTPTLLGQSTVTGTYRFIGPSEIRMVFRGLFGDSSYNFEIRLSGDRLQMRTAAGRVNEYVRQQ
jgi:hypothetical protein